MMIDKFTKDKIKAHALEEDPKECCGLIVEKNKKLICVKAKNISPKDDMFKIDPKDYLIASRLGEIVGTYHSHTDEKESFSEFDKFNSINHDLTYVLFNTKTNSISQFSPKTSQFNKYMGRKYKINDKDCFSLIRDFYEAELSISLGHYDRDEKWRTYADQLFDRHFENEGFYEVEDVKKYDCLLFHKGKGKPSSHIAIYLGGDLILHQPERSYSRIESLTDRHKKLINKIIRHKLCMN